MNRKGKLYGIGVGPGDPELLTVKACCLLEELPVLLVPKAHQGKRSLALSIVEDFLPEEQQIMEIILPMTRDEDVLKEHWEKAALQTLEVLQQGKDGGFITLGDPCIYSTFGYLWQHVRLLDKEIEVEIIPGISAVNQTGAQAGQTLVEGEESLAMITAGKPHEEMEAILESFENVVVLKAGRHLDKLIKLMEGREGREKAVLVSRAGFEDGFTTKNLAEITDKNLDYLSTVIIKR